MIIDCHTHIFPDQIRKNREDFCREDAGFSSIYKDIKAKMIGIEELISSMDETGIERSVICGFPWEKSELCSLHNRYILESASYYPNRVIPFISLQFSSPDWSLNELDRAFKEGAKGVGEVGFYNKRMTLKDIDGMKPVLEEMEMRRIPILLHTNEIIGHHYPGKGRTSIETFYKFILKFPKLPIILAHWGGGLVFYELMPEVSREMTNVFYDTAASPFIYSKRIYSIVSQIVGVERILFGSDYPLIRPERYFRELEESGLSEEDRKRILGINFSRFFV